jgi:hypothetical protein
VTERDYLRLVGFYHVVSAPLRISLAIIGVAAIVLGTSAVLVVRALATPKD